MLNMQNYGIPAATRRTPIVKAGTGTYTGFQRDLTGGMLVSCTAQGEKCKWEGMLEWDGTNRQVCVGTLPTDYPLSTTEAAGRTCIDAFTWASTAGDAKPPFQLICRGTNEDLRPYFQSKSDGDAKALMDAALQKIDNLCDPDGVNNSDGQEAGAGGRDIESWMKEFGSKGADAGNAW